ncbi:hypothetical protein E2K93_17520 [Thalassotalea sp. HSM 43]|uniref:hypothetical protein n=1 Tax=Thalassotalea sp. HSM 43 TaxID=2552945 RepID=UPI00107FD9DB|nr:hypothetical protein [Thalassotalea sp. HSM 43]QBY06051.1 hypothetical protein E2K93_17520 [Thalassotalea sp. HSM 43]
MALIDCPSCSKRISSKAAVCQHCNTVVSDMSDEKRQSMQQMARIKQQQTLMNHSMIAMLLFCGGFGFMFWGKPDPQSWQYMIGGGATAGGFLWYLANRIRIIMSKRK